MTENPLIFIFSLQDNVSDKLKPIMELTNAVSNAFAGLEATTQAISATLQQAGKTVTTLQEEIGTLREEVGSLQEEIGSLEEIGILFPMDNIDILKAYNQALIELNEFSFEDNISEQLSPVIELSEKTLNLFVELGVTLIAINSVFEKTGKSVIALKEEVESLQKEIEALQNTEVIIPVGNIEILSAYNQQLSALNQFSFEDKVSDKLVPIIDLTETLVSTFSQLEEKTLELSTVFAQTTDAISTLQEGITLLQGQNEIIPAEQIESLSAYTKEIETLANGVGSLTSINSSAFHETASAIEDLCKNITQLQNQEEWISQTAISSIEKCTEAIEKLLEQTKGLDSISGKKVEEAADSVKTLQTSVIALKAEGKWVSEEINQLFIECRQNLEEVKKGVNNLTEEVSSSNSPWDLFKEKIFSAIPALQTFTSASSIADAAISGLSNLLNKGEAAWASYKETAAQFQIEMRKNINATDEEVNSLMSLVNVQQKLGVVGKQVQMAGIEEISTHVTRNQSIQELLPTLNNVIAQQHGVNASQQQAAEIAGAFGEILNGQTDALSQYGFQFTEAQQKILEYGNEAEKITLLTETVGAAVNGVNEALADTPEGQWEQYNENMNSVYETIGKLQEQFTQLLFPVFQLGGELLGSVVEILEDKMDSIRKVLDGIITGISQAFHIVLPVIENILEVITGLFEKLLEGDPIILGITAALGSYVLMTELAAVKIDLMTIKTELQTIATKAYNVVQAICNGLLNMSPLGWIATAIGAVVAIVTICWQKFQGFREVIMGSWEVIKSFGNSLKDAIIAPLQQIGKGVSTIFSAIGKALKGDFIEAAKDAKAGFADVGKGMFNAVPVVAAYNAYQNTDIKGAYEIGKQKGTESYLASNGNNQTTINTEETQEDKNGKDGEDGKNGKNGKNGKTIFNPSTLTTPDTKNIVVEPAYRDNSMLPDLNPTAEYKAIVAGLKPQKVDLSPVKTAVDNATSNTQIDNSKEVNEIVGGSDTGAVETENTFEVNDKEQRYQPEDDKKDILQSILENVQKLVDMVKNVGNIANTFNSSLKLNNANIQVDKTENVTSSISTGDNSFKIIYGSLAIAENKLESLIRYANTTAANSEVLVSLFASYISESAGANPVQNGTSARTISESAQPEAIISINNTLVNMKNSMLQEITLAKNTLTQLYEGFNSFVENDLATGLNKAFQTLKEKLFGDISSKLQSSEIIQGIKDALNKINDFMNIDLSEIGTELSDNFLNKLEDLFDNIMGSDFVTKLTTGFENIKNKIINSIPDNLNLNSVIEGIQDAFSKLNELMDIDLSALGTELVDKFTGNLEGIFNKLMESDFATNLSKGVEDIKDKIINSIPTNLGLDKILEGVEGAINQVNNLMDIDLGEIGSQIGNTLSGKIGDLFNNLMDSDLVTNITNSFTNIKDKILNTLPEKLDLNSILEEVKEGINQINSLTDVDLIAVATDIAETFVNKLDDVFNGLMNSDLANQISAGLETFREKFKDIIPDLDLSSIVEDIKSGFGQIDKLMELDLATIGTDIANSFVGKVENFFNTIMGSELVGNITSKVDSLKTDFVASLPDNLQLENISQGITDFFNKGKALMNIDISGIQKQAETIILNQLENVLKNVTGNTSLGNFIKTTKTTIQENVNTIQEKINSDPVKKTAAEGLVNMGKSIQAGPEAFAEATLDTGIAVGREILQTAGIIETNPVAETTSLQENSINDTTGLPEKGKKTKSGKGGFLKRTLSQAGTMAFMGLTNGLINPVTIDNPINSKTRTEAIPGTTTAEDELGLLPAVNPEEEIINPAISAASENDPIGEPVFSSTESNLSLLPLPTPEEEKLTSMPSFTMTDNRLLTPEAIASPSLFDTETALTGEPEEIRETGGIFENTFDTIRQMAAITAIPLAMATVSPNSDMQSVAMLDNNTGNNTSMFEQYNDYNDRNERSIAIDQVCEQIVIHVENTDRQGTEQIKEEIYKVLREIVES